MSKKKKKKFYVVWEGKQTGIFNDWDTCKKQVFNVEGAKYKSYESKTEAETAFAKSYFEAVVLEKKLPNKPNPNAPPPIIQSIVVDAAWNSKNKNMEYQGFNFSTKERLFHKGPFAGATNNIGEFLAIVHALALLKKHTSQLPIYTDSRTAMSWVNRKFANTKLAKTENNKEVFELIKRAEDWLKANTSPNKVLKWDTKNWGENPADFGRK
jgi:ribonuclease HI